LHALPVGVSGGARWLTATLRCARAQPPLTAGAQVGHYSRVWGLRRPVAEAAAAAYLRARNSGASVDAEAAARRAALVATGRVTSLWRALALGLAQRHDAAAASIQAAWRGARARLALARRRSAATTLQAAWRGARARLALARRRSAATTLQAAWRGARARLALARRRSAATTLQAAWRGARARLALARRRAASQRIQAAWRGALARRAFAKKLQRHGPASMLSPAPVDAGVASALKHGGGPSRARMCLQQQGCLGSALPDTLTAVPSDIALQHCLCVHAGCVVQPTACVCEHDTAACHWLHECRMR